MPPELSVSEFIAVLNQTLAYAYNRINVIGEVANFRISKNKWVYFDLKDDDSILRCFGSVYQLSSPIEDGMLLKVTGYPKLHNRYGLSFNIVNVQAVGAGSIKKAASLLEKKLSKEGLFLTDRKRSIPYPPNRVGLIASSQSAAYADFIKIINNRWGGLTITTSDVQVQGDAAPDQIIGAIRELNQLAEPPEVLVITRGGGSPEDLMAFNDEKVVRAIAASRIPTLVAIGHEIDTSLAELAADKHASTPSNAAEILTPDKQDVLRSLELSLSELGAATARQISSNRDNLASAKEQLDNLTSEVLVNNRRQLKLQQQLLAAFDPSLPLKRGYALVRSDSGKLIRRASHVKQDDKISIETNDAIIKAKVRGVNAK